jgi:hypothetical protein
LILKVTIISMLLIPNVALAQEAPKVEIFGGYSFLHSNLELHGWNASVAANLNKWFGVAVDVSGHYDSSSSSFFSPGFPPQFPPTSVQITGSQNYHTFLVGPRFTDRRHDKVSFFGHVLVGITRRHNESEFNLGGSRTFNSFNSTGFAGAAGGGLDISLNKRFSLRVVQAEYFFSAPDGIEQHGARLSTGLVVKF